jgi:hypothetical protein
MGEQHPEDGWPVVALRLIEEGRMRPSGLGQIEAARSTGRWPA